MEKTSVFLTAFVSITLNYLGLVSVVVCFVRESEGEAYFGT